MITKQNLKELQKLTPKRIYLPTKKVLKKYSGKLPYYGVLNFPFKESIQSIFERDTRLKLFDSKNDRYNKTAVWLSIETEDEFNTIKNWIDEQETTVFIRSLLPICIALDVNVDYGNETKTYIGNLEYKAKSAQDEGAINELVDLLCDKIEKSDKDKFYIAAVPANIDKSFDLPTLLAEKVAAKLGCIDITNNFFYKNPKQALKSVSIDDKWQELERADLQFDKGNLDNKPVLLIDDKYQSGTTLHYVASQLNAAGFDIVSGLTIVKTIKDDDNQ